MKEHLIPEWSKTENLRWAFWGWDPLPYYQRLGRSSKPYFGNSHRCAKWRGRMHSERTIKQMSELGVNMAITQFFKGYGLVYEKDLLDELTNLVEIFHKYGMKVMGYTQLGSIFYETFLHEEPDAKNWAQRNFEGGINPWAGARYYRWEPCYNSDEFMAYMKKVLDYGFKEVGLDGYHFDNSYSKPCYCEKCRAKFREYLTANVTDPERMGLADFTFVEPPPMSKKPVILDPLEQEWIKFRCLNTAEKFGELYEHIKGLREDLAVHSNPAFPRAKGWARQYGISPYHFGKVHDLFCAENSNFPRYENDGTLITQISAYRMGESLGYQALPASWLHDPVSGGHKLPSEAEQVKLSLAEPAVFGGCVGMNWALRTTGDDNIAIDDEKLSGSAKTYIQFFEENKVLYTNAKTVAPLALLHSFGSFAFGGDEVFLAYVGLEQSLIQSQIPYNVVFEEEIEKINSYSMLILSNQMCLSDASCLAITKFVEQGGKLIFTGDTGRYDENNLEREENAFEALKSNDLVEYWADMPEMSQEMYAGGKWIRPYGSILPERHEEINSKIRSMLIDEDLPIKVTAHDSVVANFRSTPNGAFIIHLLNYDGEKAAENISVEISADFAMNKKYRILSPDSSEILEGTFSSLNNPLIIKSLEVYKLIEITPV